MSARKGFVIDSPLGSGDILAISLQIFGFNPMLHTLRKSNRAIALVVITLLLAGWLAIFCQQCFSWSEPAPSQMSSCCHHSADRPAADVMQACNVAAEMPCAMAKAFDAQATQALTDNNSNSLVKAAVLALFLVLVWGQVPAGPSPSTVLRNAASPFYDPRRLERTRLLLI